MNRNSIPMAALILIQLTVVSSLRGNPGLKVTENQIGKEPNRCAHLREGIFYYKPIPIMHIVVVRGKEIQTSYRIYPTHYKKFWIEWPEDCMYKLTMFEDTDPGIGRTVGFVSYVRIKEITPEYFDLEDKIGEEGQWNPGLRMYIAPDLETALELQRGLP